MQELIEWIKMRLYEKSHALSLALGILNVQVSNETETMGSDGQLLYINKTWLREAFLADSESLCLLFLHVLCHCMLGHPFCWNQEKEKEFSERWEIETWILLEQILAPVRDLEKKETKSWKERCIFQGQDDHTLWGRAKFSNMELTRILASGNGGKGQGENSANAKLHRKESLLLWQQAKEQAVWRGAGKKYAGNRKVNLIRSLSLTNRKRYDYRAFLKQFSNLREEGGLDMEQFDYGFYFWGLQQYGNVPLIEPLEYRERRKVEELVIVIDTSGSCSQELVRMFLEETRNVLKEEELFFRRFLLHIIQCDNQIQRDDRITSQEELDDYLQNLIIKGGGGTDFRPAFERIEELRGQELYRLKGVLYFTDGYGIYPNEMPDYHVAFVFFKYRYDDIDVPDWAQKLILDAERPRGAKYEY